MPSPIVPSPGLSGADLAKAVKSRLDVIIAQTLVRMPEEQSREVAENLAGPAAEYVDLVTQSLASAISTGGFSREDIQRRREGTEAIEDKLIEALGSQGVSSVLLDRFKQLVQSEISHLNGPSR